MASRTGAGSLREKLPIAPSRLRPTLAPVVGLFLSRGPSAVPRRIRAVIVDAVNGHASRRLTHVLQERLKGQPPITNPNATAAVSVKGGISLIQAPPLESAPYVVGASVSHAVRRVCPASDNFILEASAGSRNPASQVRGLGNRNRPALAQTFPRRPASLRGATDGRQTAKFDPAQIETLHVFDREERP